MQTITHSKWLAIFGLVTVFVGLPKLSQARVFDLREQNLYAEAFADFVQNYEKAMPVYKSQGPSAFIAAMAAKRSESDKTYLRKTLGSLPKLPVITSDQALLILDATNSNAGIHTVEVSNIDDGMLIVDGTPLEFDVAGADLETIASKISAALDRGTIKVSFLDRVENWLVPTAHAKNNVIVFLLVGALGGLGTKWLIDQYDNRAGAQSTGSDAQGSTSDH